MHRRIEMSARQRLVYHVQELERLDGLKQLASGAVKDALDVASAEGFDRATLQVVLKLRKMTQAQRQERRALESIYLAALGMLEGDPLPDEARRRLDGESRNDPGGKPSPPDADESNRETSAPKSDEVPQFKQPPLIVKDPEEARSEGAAAAAAGKRIYDNPYPAGDPCRAAWDEGWCGQSKSNGMETPAAFQRRNTKPPEKREKDDKRDGDADDERKGAE